MAQSVKGLLSKHEELRSYPQHPPHVKAWYSTESLQFESLVRNSKIPGASTGQAV